MNVPQSKRRTEQPASFKSGVINSRAAAFELLS
jgi:hypothetical protein